MNPVTRRLPVILLLVLAMGFSLACETNETNRTEPAATPGDAGESSTMADTSVIDARAVYEGAANYQNQAVTVSGEVREVYGTNAFAIGDSTWDRHLLVVFTDSITASGTSAIGSPLTDASGLQTDYVVQVTGTVRPFTPAEIEQQYGMDLDPRLDSAYQAREPVVLARTVMVMPQEIYEEATETTQ